MWIERIISAMKHNRFAERLHNLERKADAISSESARIEGHLSADLENISSRLEPLREIMQAMRKDMIARDQRKT